MMPTYHHNFLPLNNNGMHTCIHQSLLEQKVPKPFEHVGLSQQLRLSLVLPAVIALQNQFD